MCLLPLAAQSADLNIRIGNAPADGRMVIQLYDSPSAFGDFRDPVAETVVDARGPGSYRVTGVTPGPLAVVVYVDANGNGRLDRNFIGIPKEELGISNGYRPKGPPSFDRARIDVGADGAELDIALYRVLGERGRFGVGAGAIGRSSPYTDSNDNVLQPIPVITYNGERLQWFGPSLRYGLAGSGAVRLALAADYRIGAYEEDDADVLSGLGDRDDTLLLGLSLQFELPAGVDLAVGYRHDALDRIGGGAANARLSRDFQTGIVRFAPQLTLNWLGEDLGNHDFGVPAAAATAARPEYRLGSTVSFEAGIGSFIELSEAWRVIVNVSAEFLPDDVTDSPIVDTDTVIKGFAAVTYVF